MNAYRTMRKQCEDCGKSIQSANITYNNFKRLAQKEKIRNKKDSEFRKNIYDETNRMEMSSFSKIDLDEAEEMLECKGRYADYNEKWHLLIAYYALSEFDNETHIYSLPKLILDEQHKVTNWNLKKQQSIRDPLLLLWMTEAADVMIPKEIENYILEMQNNPCSHATKDDDRKLINMFTNTLWEDVATKIKKD